MREITIGDRLRYRFDNTMSRGAIALIGWLFLASAALVAIVTAVVVAAGVGPVDDDGTPQGFGAIAWMSFMRTLDAGTLGGDTGGKAFLGAMLVATLGGVFIVSSLIGILSSGLDAKLSELRKGRSLVVEEGHTLILGWSPQVFAILSELVIANESKGSSCVVVLADKDKVEMEDEIRAKVGDAGGMRIVCRTGDPIDLIDLEIGNPQASRSIIVIAPDTPDADSHVIKTLLALTSGALRRARPYRIVAEIRDPKNMIPARMVGKDEAQLVLAGELISRITVQTCRQSGLSVVYTELLDFGGDEIYFAAEPRLTGKTFGDVLNAYEDSAVIGVCAADGTVRLNPAMDTPIEEGDSVVAISRDDDTIRLSAGEASIDERAIRQAEPRPAAAERTLILGWNRRAPAIIVELEAYVAAGSEVTVVADVAEAQAVLARECSGLEKQAVTFELGDTTDRRTLDRLGVETYEHVITLSYSDTLGTQAADARTLVTLLHLRDIEEKKGGAFSIVSEMLDSKNRILAEVTHADDFIVSDRLVSLALSQISENPRLAGVFADLFDPEGSELYLKPATDYVAEGVAVTFHTVVEAARRRGEVAIGYRLASLAEDSKERYGVRVNPRKSERVALGGGDRVIVLAQS